MSSTTTDIDEQREAADAAPAGVVHQHPTDGQYVKIAVILAVITALEVGTYFWEDADTGVLVAVLFPMMVAKFAIVTGYFMHLKYDNPIFKRVFVFGLILAMIVYTVVLCSFEFWTDNYFKFIGGG